MEVLKKFIKYVSQNIIGMLGLSAYILADTIFISRAAGADGITALNLVLPVYSLIFAIGAMIGVGSAIRFSIYRARNDKQADTYFSNAIIWAFLLSLIIMIPGLINTKGLVSVLGGDEQIVTVGIRYTRTFLLFTPCFMWNHIMNAFVRNDGDPSLAMSATLCSSIFNILFDYIFMFPLHMGMVGAALATGLSPVVGVVICCIHFTKKNNTIHFRVKMPSLKKLASSCEVGISAFVGEISSGVTTFVFNMLILRIAGNIGVAAYGVVANSAMVAVAIFNGISQGSQPLFSDYYGKEERKNVSCTLRYAIATALVFATMLLYGIWKHTDFIVELFNSEHSAQMAVLAGKGLRLYFMGFIFAGINIVGTGYLSATDDPKGAFLASSLRGFLFIIPSAVLLSSIWGMRGIWLAFCVAEGMTAFFTAFFMIKKERTLVLQERKARESYQHDYAGKRRHP